MTDDARARRGRAPLSSAARPENFSPGRLLGRSRPPVDNVDAVSDATSGPLKATLSVLEPPGAPPSAAPVPPFSPPRPEDVARLAAPYHAWPYVDRRKGVDRRGRPTSILAGLMPGGARARGRRRGEDRNIYVDRYAKSDLVFATVILVLNILDAWLTIVYLGYGGAEANPVARKLLEAGCGWFLGVKGFAVSACLLFLVLHKTFSLVKPALRLLVLFYGLLLVYHLYLQASALLQGLA
jgi:hypothetical protein